MKVAENFCLQEFVSKNTWSKWGAKSMWFVDPKLFSLAQFYKEFFTMHYQADDVFIVINNWHVGGSYIGRGYREPQQYNEGQFSKRPNSESQHRYGRAFDCDIIIKNGTRYEADYIEIQKIINENKDLFMQKGLTTLEDPAIAKTWLHSDVRNTGLDHIKIVRP